MKRAAVVGLGNIAKRHRSNLKNMFPEIEIIVMSASGRMPSEAICNSDIIVQSSQTIIDYNVDIAIVASPAPFHSLHSIPLIEARIPVLIEKPVATTLEDTKAIIEAKNNYKTNVGVGYCLKYLSSALYVKDFIEAGNGGKIINANIDIGQFLPDWRPKSDYRHSVSANRALGGGVLFELSHEIDYAQWLFGKLTINHAIVRNSTELDIDVEDVVDVLATSSKGCVVTLHLDFLQKNVSRKCKIIFSKGSLVWDLIKNQVLWYDNLGKNELFIDELWDKNNMYINMLSDFDRQVKTNSFTSVESSLETLKVILDIKERFGLENIK